MPSIPPVRTSEQLATELTHLAKAVADLQPPAIVIDPNVKQQIRNLIDTMGPIAVMRAFAEVWIELLYPGHPDFK